MDPKVSVPFGCVKEYVYSLSLMVGYRKKGGGQVLRMYLL
jgi:hypothetical protein